MSTDYNKVKIKREIAVNPESEELKKRDAVVKGRERKQVCFLERESYFLEKMDSKELLNIWYVIY